MTEPTYEDVVEAVARTIQSNIGDHIKYSQCDELARQFLSTKVGNLKVAVVDMKAMPPECPNSLIAELNMRTSMIKAGFAKVVTK